MRRNGHAAPAPQRSVWAVIGIALATLLCIGGLMVLGVTVFFYIALSHYASNK